jgi:hypothetical protein
MRSVLYEAGAILPVNARWKRPGNREAGCRFRAQLKKPKLKPARKTCKWEAKSFVKGP